MALKFRQRLGKYRIERRLGEGGFANVYQAFDTIEGVRVALKVPHPHLVSKETLEDFRHEVRLAARLDHPNTLPLKNAEFIDGHFVIAYRLGEKTLADRIRSRLSMPTVLDLAEQMVAAVAHAHHHRIIHCDIKPENFILFPGNELRLTDFGISRVAQKTIRASGSGTVGYIAPEQAMGRPSFRSDVFSLGLILYRMLTGKLPEWPFEWPPPGYDKLRRRAHPDLIALVKKAIEVDPRKRFADGEAMLNALERVRPRALRYAPRRGRKKGTAGTPDWKTVRHRQFLRQFGKPLETRYRCGHCHGPVSEAMQACPWCGKSRKVFPDETKFPIECPRCKRGMKLDWKFCPWCYGPGFEPHGSREYSDVRYTGRCTNHGCQRKVMMPFMRYCPWCHRKAKRKWKIAGSADTCASCGWGVLRAYWSQCPWCGKSLQKRK